MQLTNNYSQQRLDEVTSRVSMHSQTEGDSLTLKSSSDSSEDHARMNIRIQ